MQRRKLIAGRGSAGAEALFPCNGCGHGSTRRDVIALAAYAGSAFAFGMTPALAEPAEERPQEGDVLVAIDAAAPVALAPGDIAAPQILAWPMEPGSGLVRNGSRLNKIVLVRLDPAALVGPTRERAADGVVAYSAICPHAGCEVTDWVAEPGILECPCHNSRYDPRDAAAIVDGPSTRALAALPLKITDGKLTVAKPFIGRIGIAPT
jgi:rieske iron-sulfur protein